MNVGLRDITACFEGVIPSLIATVDQSGVPNISFLSQVHFVDDTHVALTNQFFSKTVANVLASKRATVLVVDGRSGVQHILDLRFERAETSGELFERMATHLSATSAQAGLEKVMALRSADVYEVLDCRRVPAPDEVLTTPAEDEPPPGRDRLAAAARLAAEIATQTDADAMLDQALKGLSDEFAFEHTMLLVCDEGERQLTAIGSHGYASAGVGAEVAFGDGIIGMAGASRRSIRISDMSRAQRIVAAVRMTSEVEAERIIPQPGLACPQSQLATPMLSHGRLRGVLFAEAEQRFVFSREDEAAMEIIAAQLATGLRLVELESREGAGLSDRQKRRAGGDISPCFHVKYYAYDDSIFIDGAYLIKGVPGRLLHYFLTGFVEETRSEFTNREIRLDPALRLPEIKDNLETRLILLRRRLDERRAPVRIERPARGIIHLVVHGSPRIEVVACG